MKFRLLIILFVISQLCAQSNTYKRYLVKSGILEFEYSGATKGTETLYFDDYGMKEMKLQNLETTMLGITQKTNTITITDHEFIYNIDLNEKSGSKMINPMLQFIEMSKADQKKLEKIGEDILKEMGGKKTGTDTILGKKCDIWEVMGSKSWVWNYIPLKTEIDMLGVKTTMLVKSIKTDVKIPADKFKVPEGINVLEIEMDSEEE